MTRNAKHCLLASLVWAATCSAGHAALVNLGDGTVKDTATNLVWLYDWNVNGLHDWQAQTAWAEGLSFAGSDGWSLPTTAQFFTLQDGYGMAWADAFANEEQTLEGHWARDEVAANTAWAENVCWLLLCSGQAPKQLAMQAVAVRAAEVAAVIPEPPALALTLLAAAAAVAAARQPALRRRATT